MSKVSRNNPIRSSVSDSTYSLMEFEREFPDDAACLKWLVRKLYPDGIYCPTCEKVTKHHREANRPSYKCQFCGHHEHPMRETIFQDSATSLRLWFYAIHLMSATKCGISAKQLEREIGVTYKCAWRMFKQIRTLLEEDDGPKLAGKIVMDESAFGGLEKNKHASKRQYLGTGMTGKTLVFGMVGTQRSRRGQGRPEYR
jgi:transposase